MSESARGLDRRTFLTGAAALGAAALLKPALAF
ncbi:twin-arginine translocation signal domain-containing protein, partial [Eggerthella lenta]